MNARLRKLEWHGRGQPSRDRVRSGTYCFHCRKPFVGRLFDPEVQLPLAGWMKAGVAWTCPRCKARASEPPRPRAVAVCSECRASFGIANVPDAEIEARGWRKLGDFWACQRCAEAIANERD